MHNLGAPAKVEGGPGGGGQERNSGDEGLYSIHVRVKTQYWPYHTSDSVLYILVHSTGHTIDVRVYRYTTGYTTHVRVYTHNTGYTTHVRVYKHTAGHTKDVRVYRHTAGHTIDVRVCELCVLLANNLVCRLQEQLSVLVSPATRSSLLLLVLFLNFPLDSMVLLLLLLFTFLLKTSWKLRIL